MSDSTDQTLYEIRTNSISTLTTLFLHSQQEAKKSEGERNCGKILKIRDELLFFSYRALVDPINLLPFSLGKELGDERSVRDEIPRNRDTEMPSFTESARN